VKNRRCARKLAAILGFVLAAMGETAWAQSEQPLNLTGRILFGYASLSQPPYNESGPSATMEGDFSGYWRDPRILEFDVKPVVTLGQAVPGTESGNALTGGSATALILQGSSFPLTLSYSRTGSSLGEGYRSSATNPSQDVLSGAESKTTTTVFDAHQMLRFNGWPTVSLDYRDTDYNSALPEGLGGEDDHTLHDFTAHINYKEGGWLFAGRYQRSQYTTTAPDILTGTVQNDNGTTSDLGFTVSRMLPLHSTFAVSADDTKSNFSIDGSETNLSARTANVTLSGQPVDRLSSTLQMQYTSNLQASEVQQALAGAGVPGTSTSPAAATTPLTYLAAPYHVLSFNWGAAYRLGHGFTLNGNVGDSYSSPGSGTSTQWGAGLAYNRKWRSGWFSTSYSHSHYSTSVEVLNETSATGTSNTSQGPDTYSVFSQDLSLETGAVDLTQSLPRQFRLATSAHVSEGTLHEEGLPYPYHDYGGLVSLTHPVGQWTLTGSFSLEEIAANEPSIYNQSRSESASFGAAIRGLSLSGGYQYGSGLALQVGSSLLFVSNPQAVSPVLGIPVLSSTSGTNLNGSYRSRRGRLIVNGYWYRFNYTTDHLPTTSYDLFNLRASYKLRRLRLIAGFMKQSQVLGLGQSNIYNTNLKYFQIERVFRLY
jgi:hypothetical protein